MTIIFRTDTVLATSVKYSEPVQIAAGATVTIPAGVTVDLGGNTLLLAGTLKFTGTQTNFAGITNGKISTENTAGTIDGLYARLTKIDVDDFFSDGTITLTSSVVENSSVDALEKSTFNSVLFKNTAVTLLGTNNSTISKSTFVDSPVKVSAWTGPFIGQHKISESNFVGTGDVIKLDPFFNGSGYSHPLTISSSYIGGVAPSNIDSRVFDADDDIRVNTDLTATSFVSAPFTNDSKGFVVGNEVVTLAQLGLVSAVLNISFTQTTTANGQIALTLSSSDLPSGSFSFAATLSYSGSTVQYNKTTFSGSSAISASANYVGTSGTVTLSGTIAPTSGNAFATILFDASGKGTFNADITNLKINGTAPAFTDPAAYSFSILGEAVSLSINGSATGSYAPLQFGFSPSYSVKNTPLNGTVTFGQGMTPAAWKYTPAAGFYGLDSFTLKVSDLFDSKEKSFSVHVSPIGTANNDTFLSSAANYQTDGGGGLDTLKYSGKMADFTVTKSGSTAVVTDKAGAEGTNTLTNFERLIFSDGAIAVDIDGVAGQAYRLYQAAFNRTPDAAGIGFWISVLDKGASLESVAAGFMASSEFKSAYGFAPTNTMLISKLYENILHRQPEKAGLDYWVSVLDKKLASEAQVLAAISESAENQAGVALAIGNGFAYVPFGS